MKFDIRKLLSGEKRAAAPDTPPGVMANRCCGAKGVLVLVHGFSGGPDSWTSFANLLLEDERIADWDLFRIAYPTEFRIDVPHLWTADPDLTICAKQLRTALGTSPLRDYKAVALVAHSMGGLVVQRAIADDDALRTRLSHVVLYGTPSDGLRKAGLGAAFKRQWRDMGRGGAFVTELRARWNEVVGNAPRFTFLAAAGNRDVFVGAESSIGPFPDHQVAVIAGDHLQIVAPDDRDHMGYALLVDLLRDVARSKSPVPGALVAAERGGHYQAVDVLLPLVAELDDAALETLALSLDSLGRGDEALKVLQDHLDRKQPTSNLLGILGGRVKRRWLTDRKESDRVSASAHYAAGLAIAEEARKPDQCFYHAINLAFLSLMASHKDLEAPAEAREYAQRALDECGRASPSRWADATRGEALLVLGDLAEAEAAYTTAARASGSVRDRDSMYAQAVLVADRMFGEDGVKVIQKAFALA